jgi:hypothetical protein
VAEKGGEGVAATPAAPKAEVGGGAGGGDGDGRGGGAGGGGGGGGAGAGGSEVKAAERHVEKVAAPSLPSAARPVSAAHQTQCCGKLKVCISARYGFGHREWHGSVSTRYV